MKSFLLLLALSLIARAAAPTTLANFPNSMVYAVQTDAAGNIYVAGFQGNFAKANPFVAKLSPTGQTLYSTTFAGSDFGIAWAIALDSSGDVYVFGTTNSPDFPVTPGALQTTMQGSFQGFVSKLDPNGKIVYSTFIGGAANVTPGLTSAPGLDSILVDAAGDAIITGQAATNPMTGTFPPAPAPVVGSSGAFVLKLDPTGSKILAAISGVGGMIAMDSQSNIYVAGLQNGASNNPLPITPGAFQSEPSTNPCGLLGASVTCGYQYVAKLNPGLSNVIYATYVSGEYGATPAAISVDAQGDAFVAGTTVSPDYPTTPSAYEPQYIASAVPRVSCFFIFHCINAPPATGYVTEVNPAGTGLVYSSFFGGTQTDTITFAGFTPKAIYLGGNAGSDDLPGFTGYPQPCLPQPYATRLSGDATEVGASRVVPGKVLAYDAFAGTLIATTGTDVVAVDPAAPRTPIACILDSADLRPVTSIAPGELLSLFGEFSSVGATTPPPGQVITSLDGITVETNGIPSPLLYVSGEQINFQAPFEIAGTAQANISFTSTHQQLSDSRTLPIVATNPAAFINTPVPPPALQPCIFESSASVNGTFPLALNPDGSINACTNPAPAGSVVTLFLDGLGVTSPAQASGAITPNPGPALISPVITANTANGGVTVVSVSALPGAISGVAQVKLQIPANESSGANQVSLSAGSVPVRDANLIVWVK
jgi:uncharacterized protein (TIGR03437 family)